MAMIQFAINSKRNKKMTLKEIYNWIEDHFPYFRNVAKPGWKVIKGELKITNVDSNIFNDRRVEFTPNVVGLFVLFFKELHSP